MADDAISVSTTGVDIHTTISCTNCTARLCLPIGSRRFTASAAMRSGWTHGKYWYCPKCSVGTIVEGLTEAEIDVLYTIYHAYGRYVTAEYMPDTNNLYTNGLISYMTLFDGKTKLYLLTPKGFEVLKMDWQGKSNRAPWDRLSSHQSELLGELQKNGKVPKRNRWNSFAFNALELNGYIEPTALDHSIPRKLIKQGG